MSFNTISVVGLGYIGLPTATMFASKEKKVIGVDVNQHTVDTINAGKIHIVEPELDLMVKKAVDRGFLKATTTTEPADAFLIAVPTPFLPIKDRDSIPEPDLSYIKSAAKVVAKVLKKGDLVILESTSPVGTTEQMSVWLAEERSDLSFPQTHGEDSDVRVAYCPERVLPGRVVRELIDNDRLIGGMTDNCSKTAIELYKIIVEGDCIQTNAETAEMAKLTENACRDVQIAFANELSVICDKLNINVWELISLANLHPRINILKPGPGVGGHCIAVDPWFIVSKTPNESKLIQAAREINNCKPDWVVNKVHDVISNILHEETNISLSDIKIICYGLTFKPDIDDLRESPAVQITKALSKKYSNQVYAIDPYITDNALEILKGIQLISEPDLIAATYIIKVLLVDHQKKDFIKCQPSNFEVVVDTIGFLEKF
jgi:UDP-N-acetyl-D-mannosaminuronic acid dehydrogenase